MNTPSEPRALLHRVGHLPASGRLLVALLMGAIAWWLTPLHYQPLARLLIGWDSFGLISLALIWIGMYTADADRIRAVAAAEDLSRAVSFVFVLVAASASLLAVVVLLSTSHGLGPAAMARHIALSILAVGTAWLLVHTVFTLRYAHIYYDANPDGSDVGGLVFPGNDQLEPDYLDMAYFSFVVGMTAQTADISISGREIRRLALLHGLISFGFNTALIALVISGVGGVL
ncbi:DUF1345 domain-containing protein [Hymenobacter sp. BRD128]|uniref:DUF1345 domain-containing protein n=1 Tax=Hymenobacter sp. BRD128 TaxID=2675878 RepID=UPI00156650D1|nr:DUF1345 domain-containing protein [Hymenobacter sp. BRD128]QKG58301.1 DUF1345 domain-containing protein [Hymenobacter sp. BRD128]